MYIEVFLFLKYIHTCVCTMECIVSNFKIYINIDDHVFAFCIVSYFIIYIVTVHYALFPLFYSLGGISVVVF